MSQDEDLLVMGSGLGSARSRVRGRKSAGLRLKNAMVQYARVEREVGVGLWTR